MPRRRPRPRPLQQGSRRSDEPAELGGARCFKRRCRSSTGDGEEPTLADLGDGAPLTAPVAILPDPRSFAEVVALAGAKRDMMLKLHLEDHVSLVKFDAATGSIDLICCPARRPNLPTTCAKS